MKLVNYIEKKITASDGIAKTTYERIHCEGNSKTKTFIGGMFSILIKYYVMYIGIINLAKMFGYDTPYIKSIERGIDTSDGDKVIMN